jgi:hypothetical protein
MITIIMRGENFLAHLDGLGDTPVCRGTPVARHCSKEPGEKEDGKNCFLAKVMYVCNERTRNVMPLRWR